MRTRVVQTQPEVFPLTAGLDDLDHRQTRILEEFHTSKTYFATFQGLFKSCAAAPDLSEYVGILWSDDLGDLLPDKVLPEEMNQPRNYRIVNELTGQTLTMISYLPQSQAS